MVQELLLLLGQRLVSRDQVDLARPPDAGPSNDLVPDSGDQDERHSQVCHEEVVGAQRGAPDGIQRVGEEADQDQKGTDAQEDGRDGPESGLVHVLAFEDGAFLSANGGVEADTADGEHDPRRHEDGGGDAGKPVGNKKKEKLARS